MQIKNEKSAERKLINICGKNPVYLRVTLTRLVLKKDLRKLYSFYVFWMKFKMFKLLIDFKAYEQKCKSNLLNLNITIV